MLKAEPKSPSASSPRDGADDYLAKPFSPNELVRAYARCSAGLTGSRHPPAADLRPDSGRPERHTVCRTPRRDAEAKSFSCSSISSSIADVFIARRPPRTGVGLSLHRRNPHVDVHVGACAKTALLTRRSSPSSNSATSSSIARLTTDDDRPRPPTADCRLPIADWRCRLATDDC